MVSLPETVGIEVSPSTPATLLDTFQKAGFRWARVDFPWDAVEKQRGVYDLVAYDTLATELKRRDMEPIFTLGFLNPLYDNGQPPHSAEALAAYAAFAGAAARQFRKTVKTWEIGSEPDTEAAWKGQPNPADYAALALAAEKTLRAENPKSVILSGGTKGINLPFLQAAFSHGLSRAIDGVGIHFVGTSSPESLADPLKELKNFLNEYAAHRNLEVWFSKVQFGAGNSPAEAEKGALYVVRCMLYDFGKNLPVTLWSPAAEDLPTVPLANPTPTPHPDTPPAPPAFRAVEFMNRALNGLKLVRPRELPSPMNGLVFGSRHKEINVLWTSTGERDLKVRLRGAPSEGVPVFDAFGQPQAPLKGKEATVHLTETPLYVEGRLDVIGYGPGDASPM
jgi:hypothetical protein